MSRIVSIEGNIGSGKSTLITRLKQYVSDHPSIHTIQFIQEPVDEWNEMKDAEGKSIVENFYANQKEYAFSFQIMAYITRLRKIIQAVDDHPDCIYVCERSLETDRNVFAKMLYDNQKIRDIDWRIYNYWFDTFLDKIQTNTIIYVSTKPSICHMRVQERDRKGEESIPLEYLQACDDYHTRWLTHTTIPVKTMNGNIDINDQEQYQKLIQSVLDVITT